MANITNTPKGVCSYCSSAKMTPRKCSSCSFCSPISLVKTMNASRDTPADRRTNRTSTGDGTFREGTPIGQRRPRSNRAKPLAVPVKPAPHGSRPATHRVRPGGHRMGWRPKPGALRAIDGTRRGDRFNPNEPMPEVGVPECPAFVVGAAREHWNALAGELADAGLLTVLDGAAFALYCVAHARWLAAERELAIAPCGPRKRSLCSRDKRGPTCREPVPNSGLAADGQVPRNRGLTYDRSRKSRLVRNFRGRS